MKHHYFNRGITDEEGMDSRGIIMGNNIVLNIFKNNGYKTFFLSQGAYFLMNSPKIKYDYCNFSEKDIGFISQGIDNRKDIFPDLKKIVTDSSKTPKFLFIQLFNPRHIRSLERGARGKKIEKESWVENLHVANKELKKIVSFITEKDPNALIIIMSDHGGFVGMDATNDFLTKTLDRDLIYSVYSSIFSIKFPEHLNEDTFAFNRLKTSVNLFRVLLSYLSENKNFLTKLQDNSSFAIIYKGAPRGIYQYIDDNGAIVFKRKN